MRDRTPYPTNLVVARDAVASPGRVYVEQRKPLSHDAAWQRAPRPHNRIESNTQGQSGVVGISGPLTVRVPPGSNAKSPRDWRVIKSGSGKAIGTSIHEQLVQRDWVSAVPAHRKAPGRWAVDNAV
jgi:hypothetical protein